ncbi:hypothetical protein LguiB_005851 [Lonicera macranthoides]
MDDECLDCELNQMKRMKTFDLNKIPQEEENIESNESVEEMNVKNDFQPFPGHDYEKECNGDWPIFISVILSELTAPLTGFSQALFIEATKKKNGGFLSLHADPDLASFLFLDGFLSLRPFLDLLQILKWLLFLV